MEKILVLRGGALGDFIVTLPALAALREKWPASRIELAGNAAAAELARARGLIDAVHSQHEARWSALYAGGALPLPFASWLSRFDLVVNYWPDAGGELRSRFPVRAGQVFVSSPALPVRAPAAAHYAEPLRALGVEVRHYVCRLPPLPGAAVEERRAEDMLASKLPADPCARAGSEPLAGARTCIAVHPGSGSPRKNWPVKRWAEICTWLTRELGAEVLIITGEAEAGDALAEFGCRAHRLPLEELVAQFSRCRLFLGHDSGVSHLAAACAVPCVLLFGPTEPAMWAPPAPHIHVLRRGTAITSISVEEVRAAVASALAA